jgi:MFS family permease
LSRISRVRQQQVGRFLIKLIDPRGTAMTKTLMTLAAAATLASAIAAPTPAEARGGAVAAGVIGGLAAGAIIGGAVARPYGYYGGPYYAAAPYDCGWRRERYWDGFRWRVHRVRVC